jgi:hypothetical protein
MKPLLALFTPKLDVTAAEIGTIYAVTQIFA